MSIRNSMLPLFAAATMFTALAQNGPGPRVSTFPTVGLGSTETASISVVNLASDGNTVKASCTGSISFVNSAGATIASATKTFTVAAGQTFTATLPFSSSGGSSPRTEIRGVVQLNAASTSPRPPCFAEFSMETWDTSSGATHTLQTTFVQEPGPGFRN